MAEIIDVNFSGQQKVEKDTKTVWRNEDGNVSLYYRKGAKKRTLYYYMSIPPSNYPERKSTGFTKLKDAILFAETRYDELCRLARQGYDLNVPKFKKVAKEYATNLRAKVSAGTRKLSSHRLDDVDRRLQNYLIPYFGDKTLDMISGKDMDDFYNYRLRLYEAEKEVRKDRKKYMKKGTKSIAYTVVDPVTKKKIERDYTVFDAVKWLARIGNNQAASCCRHRTYLSVSSKFKLNIAV